MNDSCLRKKIGEAAVETVEAKYSISANKAAYLQILDELS